LGGGGVASASIAGEPGGRGRAAARAPGAHRRAAVDAAGAARIRRAPRPPRAAAASAARGPEADRPAAAGVPGALARVHGRAPQPRSLNTFPSFITKTTFSRAFTSFSGSPLTATTSASAPGAMTPSWPFIPSISAARDVADWIACIGVIPYWTMYGNSFAIGSFQEQPPT